MPFLDLCTGDEVPDALLASSLEGFQHTQLPGVLLDDDAGQPQRRYAERDFDVGGVFGWNENGEHNGGIGEATEAEIR